MTGDQARGIAILMNVATQFITVHGVAGQLFFINPTLITTLREPVGDDRKHFPSGTHCVVVQADGKFVPVTETCGEVRDLAMHLPR